MSLATQLASVVPADFAEAIACVGAFAAAFEAASPSQRSRLRVAAAGERGLLARSRSRRCGVSVSLYDGPESGLDSSAKYAIVCDDHGGVVGFEKRRDAEGFMATPDRWCPYCSGQEPVEPSVEPFQGTAGRPYNASRAASPCVVCGRHVGSPRAYARVVRGEGGYRWAAPDEVVDGEEDMGAYPVGSECLRKLGRFAVPA